ncbi:MAG: DUF3035 domain-containing protein [Pseudomonadota bacterium]
MRFVDTLKRTSASAMPAVLTTALLLSVGGCARIGEVLGVEATPPDEFTVVTQAPLIVPPDFNLKPPRPGEPQVSNLDTSGEAISALFPGRTTLPEPSPGELALLRAAGALDTDRDARSQVQDEGTLVADKGIFLHDILTTEEGTVPGGEVEVERIESEPLEIAEDQSSRR